MCASGTDQNRRKTDCQNHQANGQKLFIFMTFGQQPGNKFIGPQKIGHCSQYGG